MLMLSLQGVASGNPDCRRRVWHERARKDPDTPRAGVPRPSRQASARLPSSRRCLPRSRRPRRRTLAAFALASLACGRPSSFSHLEQAQKRPRGILEISPSGPVVWPSAPPSPRAPAPQSLRSTTRRGDEPPISPPIATRPRCGLPGRPVEPPAEGLASTTEKAPRRHP